MGIGDEQKRSLASAPAYPACLRSPVEEQSEAFRRRLRPMRCRHLLVCGSEPGAVLYFQLLIPGTGQKPALAKGRIAVAQLCQSPHESRDRLRSLVMIPVNPGNLVILAVSIIVTLLGAPELVSTEQHWRALGEEQRCEDVSRLPRAQLDDLRVIRAALESMVP